MNTFEEISIIKLDHSYIARLRLDEMTIVYIEIRLRKSGTGYWRYGSGVREEYYKFELKDGCFHIDEHVLSEEEINFLQRGFLEIIRQLKHLPNYRFKIFNTLDEESRKVWDTI